MDLASDGTMRTCVRMTSKGSITGQLQRAIAAGDVLAVRSLAGELPHVPLPMAAEITLLLLEREPEVYAPAARRLLARVANERIVALGGLVDIAAVLAELERDPAFTANPKLLELIGGRRAPSQDQPRPLCSRGATGTDRGGAAAARLAAVARHWRSCGAS